MKVRSIRRIVADANHNMDTGAAFFKGALYVAYRQGDAHVSPNGKLLVIRSRDEGLSFEHAGCFRGQTDTRDPHLYKVGDGRLHVVGFETTPVYITGTAWTEDGLRWSPWTRFTGADGWWLWHPEHHKGRYYCAGYTWKEGRSDWSAVAWFESDNGIDWRKVQVLREGAECPSECNLLFMPDDTAVLLVRRDHASHRPLLMRSAPPYRQWEAQEIDLPIEGLALWAVGGELWMAGRWFLDVERAYHGVAHMGVFRLEEGKPQLKMVLPSGPHFDFGYMAAARHPLNSARLMLTYYSNHTAPDDPRVDQWSHPDIYLVDATFATEFIVDWRMSDLQAIALSAAACPDPDSSGLSWRKVRAAEEPREGEGFVDAHEMIASRPGVVYFVTDIQAASAGRGAIHLGYDGPVRVWLNGKQVFEGPGTNPAVPDQTSIPAAFQAGRNRLAIALDTHGGKAWGIFGRYELQGD